MAFTHQLTNMQLIQRTILITTRHNDNKNTPIIVIQRPSHPISTNMHVTIQLSAPLHPQHSCAHWHNPLNAQGLRHVSPKSMP
jgi:hypothetical protein